MRRSRIGAVAVVALAAVGVGCGGEDIAQYRVGAAKRVWSRETSPAVAAETAAAPAAEPVASGLAMRSEGGMATTEAPAGAGEVPPGVPRKIIYSADIALIVEKFDDVAEQVVRLVDRSGGYVAESDLGGTPGAPRLGHWKVRVPVEKFESFVESVASLGELQRRHTDSREVTEEFYDLEARIENKEVEEQRLIKHLEETTGKLEDILNVEKELSRVREESERMQGRLRLLENLTALTTVSISIEERLGYLPVAAPSFGDRVGNRFRESLDQLLGFGEWVVLAVAAVVPWLPVWIVALAVAWLVVRHFRHRWMARAASGESGAAP